MFYIISDQCGLVIAERGADYVVRPLHSKPMQSAEAAERLRADLAAAACPLDVGPSSSCSWNPIQNAADAYEVAVRILPLLEKRKDAWRLALRIADARPWQCPSFGTDFDSDIPF